VPVGPAGCCGTILALDPVNRPRPAISALHTAHNYHHDNISVNFLTMKSSGVLISTAVSQFEPEDAFGKLRARAIEVTKC
jgi:hypothetical protein